MPSEAIKLLEIIFLFILPVFLIYFKIISYKYKLLILGLISVIAVILSFFEKYSLKQIGLRLDNFLNSLIPYLLFTGVGLLVIFCVAKISKTNFNANIIKDKKFLLLFIPISFLQEFLFRGFLILKLQELFSSLFLIIIINAFLFLLVHLVYSNNFYTLLMIFLGGIGFTWIYLMYPNLILISISHSILNFIAISYNFYSEEK